MRIQKYQKKPIESYSILVRHDLNEISINSPNYEYELFNHKNIKVYIFLKIVMVFPDFSVLLD